MRSERLAVIFPGLGYTHERPLLYYAANMARSMGYSVVSVAYGNLPRIDRASPGSVDRALDAALEQAERALPSMNLNSYKDILCVSKSLGTAVSSALSCRHGIKASHIFFTPLERTFGFPVEKALAFHGTKDQWFDFKECRAACREADIPLHAVEGADHSLETGDVLRDVSNIHEIMEIALGFMASL